MWGIILHYNSKIGLARQIFLSLKERILTGQIQQGEALPSTRELAKGLGVSRNTVCDAYDMLWTEGFIVSRQGAPSRVADGLHIQSIQRSEKTKETEKNRPVILWDFKTGQPDLSFFPWQAWNEIICRDIQQSIVSGPPIGFCGVAKTVTGQMEALPKLYGCSKSYSGTGSAGRISTKEENGQTRPAYAPVIWRKAAYLVKVFGSGVW